MLCLARAIRIWSYEIMPALVTKRAKVRSWTAACLIAKQMIGRPMMIFGTLRAADFTNEWQVHWMELLNVNIGSLNSLAFRIPLCATAAPNTNKWVLRVASGVDIEADAPPKTTAVFAGVGWILNFIFPRGIDHEILPVLR